MRKIYYGAFLFFFFTLKALIILALSAFYSLVAVFCLLSVILKICCFKLLKVHQSDLLFSCIYGNTKK